MHVPFSVIAPKIPSLLYCDLLFDCHFVVENLGSHHRSILTALQVLLQLPEGLAISVLAASSADVFQHLSTLPTSLHPLAIEAAFPSICRHRCLTLDVAFLRNPNTIFAVLRVATTGTSSLRKLHLKSIPTWSNHLLQLISAACMLALDVSLHFILSNPQHMAESQFFVQLGNTLLHNTALTSLQLTFQDFACHLFNLAYLLESLTGLRCLALVSSSGCPSCVPPPGDLPPPRHIVNQLCLTRLC
jgi:hypothetical protein